MHGNALCLFLVNFRATDIAAIGNILNPFVLKQLLTKIRTHHLSDNERMLYVLSLIREFHNLELMSDASCICVKNQNTVTWDNVKKCNNPFKAMYVFI